MREYSAQGGFGMALVARDRLKRPLEPAKFPFLTCLTLPPALHIRRDLSETGRWSETSKTLSESQFRTRNRATREPPQVLRGVPGRPVAGTRLLFSALAMVATANCFGKTNADSQSADPQA